MAKKQTKKTEPAETIELIRRHLDAIEILSSDLYGKKYAVVCYHIALEVAMLQQRLEDIVAAGKDSQK